MVASLMMGSNTTNTLLQQQPPLPRLTHHHSNASKDLDASDLSTTQHYLNVRDSNLQENSNQLYQKDKSHNNSLKMQDGERKETEDNVSQIKEETEIIEETKEQEENVSRRQELYQLQGQEQEEEEGWEAGEWPGSDALCQGAAFFINLVTAGSAITVAIIALDRYLAIVRPMVYGLMVTGNRCLLMLAWCWVQALLTALPPLLGWARYEHRGPEGRCGVAWSSSPSYTAVWVITVFLTPVIIMLVCYYFILQVSFLISSWLALEIQCHLYQIL
ncbi:uncharacterized protein LOC121869575 [Homarus americanus]|uniref:uncharacterized protein LOC121869575 n=1 Tax=Homarus americanus TaxID=6706 RepID=UPI001C479CBF|nr:uncharacterized protein LOC121869575 [Homarus americanus]